MLSYLGLLLKGRRLEKLRALSAGARAAQRQVASKQSQMRAARQFVSQVRPSSVILPLEDFPSIQPYERYYLAKDGSVADYHRRVQPRYQVVRNVNRARAVSLPSVHDYFDKPASLVNICEKRKQRRQVIFALGLRRKGSKLGKPHKWKQSSLVRCLYNGYQLLPHSVPTEL